MPSKTAALLAPCLVSLSLLVPFGAAAEGPAGAIGVGALGDFRMTGMADDCPIGARCANFMVECPGLAPSRGVLTRHAASEPSQLVIAHGGGIGDARWSEYGLGEPFLSRATARGSQIVEIQWDDNWMTAQPGEETGLRALACRPATVLAWLHEKELAGLERREGSGLGMVWLGSSSGSLAAAYALAFYGADQYLDAAHLAGGPPLTDMIGGCQATIDDRYRLSDFGIRTIDRSYGYAGGGPCDASDASWAARFLEDSLMAPDAARNFRQTDIHLYWGDEDPTSAPAHAQLWSDHLVAAGTSVNEHVYAGGHTIQDSRPGLRDLLANLG